MPRFRVSIAGLLTLVAVVALWMASLRSASVWWTSIFSTLTLGILLTAVLGVFFLRGPDRAFWAGFALFGLVYLALVNWDWIGAQFGHDLTSGLSALANAVIPPVPALNPPNTQATQQHYELARNHQVMLGNFAQIGRLTLDLLFALVGGYVGRAMAFKTARQDGAAQ